VQPAPSCCDARLRITAEYDSIRWADSSYANIQKLAQVGLPLSEDAAHAEDTEEADDRADSQARQLSNERELRREREANRRCRRRAGGRWVPCLPQ
jgi:hypothetical protein